MSQRSAAIIIKDGRILLMRRLRDGFEYYAVPGGTIEEGETSEAATIREVKEETDLDVELGKLFLNLKASRATNIFFWLKILLEKKNLAGQS